MCDQVPPCWLRLGGGAAIQKKVRYHSSAAAYVNSSLDLLGDTAGCPCARLDEPDLIHILLDFALEAYS